MDGSVIVAELRMQVFSCCSQYLGYDSRVLLDFYEHDNIKCLKCQGGTSELCCKICWHLETSVELEGLWRRIQRQSNLHKKCCKCVFHMVLVQ